MASESQSQVYAPDEGFSADESDHFQKYHRKPDKVDENGIEGKWTDEQSITYALFMDFHSKIFVSKEKRKSTRIFKALSTLLKTRTPRQCRSHFQKLMSKYKTVKKVKHFYLEQIGSSNYEQRFSILAKKLKGGIRAEESIDYKSIVQTNTVAIQTEPMSVSLLDLAEGELSKLMELVENRQKNRSQYWFGPNFIPPPMHYPF